MLTADQLKAVDVFTVTEGIPVEADVSLKRYSYFESGGLATRTLSPNEEPQPQRLLTFMSRESLPCKVIGDTSNIMFLDDRRYGVFVSLRAFHKIELSDTEPAIITAQAGAASPEFAR